MQSEEGACFIVISLCRCELLTEIQLQHSWLWAGGAAQQHAGRAALNCSAGRSPVLRCDGPAGKALMEKGEACSAPCKAKPLTEQPLHWRSR